MNIQSYTDIEQAVESTASYYQRLFLDYWNNFITLGGFAEYYGFSDDEAYRAISIGRKIHNQRAESEAANG